MPFAWRQFEPTKVGQVEKYDIPLNDWMGIKFGEGLSSGFGRAAWDRAEDFAWDTGEKVAPAILNKSFAIDGYLEFTEPTTVGRAYLIRERKLEELERMKMLDSASHSAFSGKAFAGFIASMAGGFANPVDLGTAFIPFVGSAAKAGGIAKVGTGVGGAVKYGAVRQAIQRGRAAIARGIVTEEAIGAGRGAKLSAAMIDGVLSQAAVEVPIAIEKTRNKAEYGLQDSLFNVIAGGLFAGGLNLAGQAIEVAYKKAIKAAIDWHDRANPETKEALFKEHVDSHISGNRPDTHLLIRIDEESIRRKVEAERFDSEAAKMEGMRNEQTWNELRGEVTTAVEKANKALTDGDVAGAVAAIQSLPTSGEMIGSAVDITKQIPAIKKLAQDLPDLNRVMVDDRPLSQWLNDVEVGKISTLTKYQTLTDEQLKKIIASQRPETFKKAAREILESRQLAQDFPYQRAVETERQKRIAEFVEKKRQEWKDGLEGRVSKAKQAEIARQQAEGKQLSSEDAARYKSKAKADRSDVEIVKQDAESIGEEVASTIGLPSKAQPETPRPVSAAELTQADIDEIAKELKELDMDVDSFLTQAKAVRGAAPCAGKRG